MCPKHQRVQRRADSPRHRADTRPAGGDPTTTPEGAATPRETSVPVSVCKPSVDRDTDSPSWVRIALRAAMAQVAREVVYLLFRAYF